MKELNVIKDQNGSFTVNVESKGQTGVVEYIPFYGIYEEKVMENETNKAPEDDTPCNANNYAVRKLLDGPWRPDSGR